MARLGTGPLGDVYRATRLTWGDIVAIRVFPAPRRTLTWRTAEVDIQRLTGWRHPSVVNVREVVIADDVAHVVMDFAGGGSLTEVLTARGTHLSMLEAISIGEQTAAALAAGHSRGVVHRAVRAHNLLFDDDSRVKLADLGFGSLRDPHDTRLRSGVPTIRDIAPEVVDGQEPSEAADVYQFGAMLTHLTRDRPGSRPPNTKELRQASDRMRALFAACLTPSPRTRPTAVGLHDELTEIAISLGQEPATTTTLPTRTAEPSSAPVPVQARATVAPLLHPAPTIVPPPRPAPSITPPPEPAIDTPATEPIIPTRRPTTDYRTAASTHHHPATRTAASTHHHPATRHPATRTSNRHASDRTCHPTRRRTTDNRTAASTHHHPATRTSDRHTSDQTRHTNRRPQAGNRTAANTHHHPAIRTSDRQTSEKTRRPNGRPQAENRSPANPRDRSAARASDRHTSDRTRNPTRRPAPGNRRHRGHSGRGTSGTGGTAAGEHRTRCHPGCGCGEDITAGRTTRIRARR